jgi:hypothetical protein
MVDMMERSEQTMASSLEKVAKTMESFTDSISLLAKALAQPTYSQQSQPPVQTYPCVPHSYQQSYGQDTARTAMTYGTHTNPNTDKTYTTM